MKRLILIIALAVTLLGFVPAVLAGGWAIVSLDELPGEVYAGETVTIGFTVLQHGITPVQNLGSDYPVEPLLVATHKATAQRITVEAAPTEKPGHFLVDVAFPMGGLWLWSITPHPFAEQPLAPLTVQPESGGSLLRIIRSFLGGTALKVTPSSPRMQAAPATTGQALFVAKGCASCHDRGLNGAPNLTVYKPDAAFLRRWLADPAAVRPDTLMPDLPLSDAEIDALIAYLAEISTR